MGTEFVSRQLRSIGWNLKNKYEEKNSSKYVFTDGKFKLDSFFQRA